VADPALQIWEGQIERKKIWRGKPKKVNKIKGKILFEKYSGGGGPGPPSPHVGPPLAVALNRSHHLIINNKRTLA
jgi:hypothetical protein